ncbi:MAG TPA: hypothetical protein VJ547_03225 [Candidatus Thermoplasmatota archaeon]|nr:hypothetical protein [Candidatus Thermoplasmatota archaeon]
MEPDGAEVAKRANRMHQLLRLLREAEDEESGVRPQHPPRRGLAPARDR